MKQGRDNCVFVHVTLVPWIAAAQELKTKPTQHSVKELRAIGIQPDILLCRSERSIPPEMKDKIALFCDVDPGRRGHRPGRATRSMRSHWYSPARVWMRWSLRLLKLEAPACAT